MTNQSKVGWCKRQSPYINSSKAAQDTLTLALTLGDQLNYLAGWPPGATPGHPRLTASAQPALLQHTTLGSLRTWSLSCKTEE